MPILIRYFHFGTISMTFLRIIPKIAVNIPTKYNCIATYPLLNRLKLWKRLIQISESCQTLIVLKWISSLFLFLILQYYD